MCSLLRKTLAFAVCACCIFQASVSNAQELLGYWQFEETSTDQPAADSSGNGHAGEYEGEVELNGSGPDGFGSAVYLDGFDGKVYLGPGDENGFGDLTSNFSVMAWINPDQFDSKNRVFGSAPWEANSGWGWGTVRDELEITTWGVKDYDQPVPLELEEWAHVAIVLDEDFTAHFYHNGEFIGTQEHAAEGGPTINDFYIGYAAVDAEHFSGYLDEVAIFDGTLTEDQIVNAMKFGALNINGQGVAGDYNGNGARDTEDIDLLSEAIRTNNSGSQYDLNGDGNVDAADRTHWVETLTNTYFGDSNFDGEFSSSDFVAVFSAAQYETGRPAGWAQGDWNGDGSFDSSDFVAAFTGGGYEAGARAGGLQTVPEPSSMALVMIGLFGLARVARRR
ncbi:MAG: PEP-CTERM sorting domain-containing protein [Planctomycetales bacterium]|nr:PEP-CTERM sorting domain-containing protein [Planctomycetales bacterium]